ncbi:MAG: hypothetical protein ACOCXT_02500 [Candidatus Dojkabacteria bacterium]
MRKHTVSPKLLCTRFGALTLSLATIIFLFPSVHAAGLQNMSITGTGITNDAAPAGSAVTPTLTFDITNSIVSGGTTNIKLNGVQTNSLIETGIITTTGCTGTATLAASVPASTANPEFAISGLACTDPGTVTFTFPAVTTLNTPGNYAIDITTPQDAGSMFFYVGSVNDVSITGTISDSISFLIRDTDGVTQLPLLNGTSGPYLCTMDPNPMETTNISTCGYRLLVGTNNPGGFTISYRSSGTYPGFANASGVAFTDAAATGEDPTVVTAGTERYGVIIDEGEVAQGTGLVSRNGNFNNTVTDLYGYSDATDTAVITSAGANDFSGTEAVNSTLVTHRATVGSTTDAGVYSQTVTYTVSVNY